MSDEQSIESMVRQSERYASTADWYPALSLLADGLMAVDRRLAALTGRRPEGGPVPAASGMPDAEAIGRRVWERWDKTGRDLDGLQGPDGKPMSASGVMIAIVAEFVYPALLQAHAAGRLEGVEVAARHTETRFEWPHRDRLASEIRALKE